RIDTRTRDVRVADRRVQLAQKEYELLVRLAREPERVFTKGELLRDVWNYRVAGRTRTLDSHASRLRRKLREAGSQATLVENVWGVGYRLLGVLPDEWPLQGGPACQGRRVSAHAFRAAHPRAAERLGRCERE